MAEIHYDHDEQAHAKIVTADDLQVAETILVQALAGGTDLDLQLFRAGIENEAIHNFCGHHIVTLGRRLPMMDPRLDPALRTMLRHVLLVGVIAGRRAADV